METRRITISAKELAKALKECTSVFSSHRSKRSVREHLLAIRFSENMTTIVGANHDTLVVKRIISETDTTSSDTVTLSLEVEIDKQLRNKIKSLLNVKGTVTVSLTQRENLYSIIIVDNGQPIEFFQGKPDKSIEPSYADLIDVDDDSIDWRLEVNANKFINIFSAAVPTVGDDYTHEVFNYVNVAFYDDRLETQATNGHIASINALVLDQPSSHNAFSVLINPKVKKAFQAVKTASRNGFVKIGVIGDGQFVIFRFAGTDVVTTVKDGRYPDIHSVVPDEKTSTYAVNVPTAQLLNIIKQTKANKTKIIAFQLNSEAIEIANKFNNERGTIVDDSDYPQYDHGAVVVHAQSSSEPLTWGVSIDQLTASRIKALGESDTITLYLRDEKSSGLIMPTDQPKGMQHKIVVMPLRLNRHH